MKEKPMFSFLIHRFKKKFTWDSHSECTKSRIFQESQLLILRKARTDAVNRMIKTELELRHAKQEIRDLKVINKRLRNSLRDKKGHHGN